GLYHWLRTQLRRNIGSGLTNRLWTVSLLAAGHITALIWAFWNISPRSSSHDSVLLLLFFYLALHSGILLIATVLQALRATRGYLSVSAPYEVAVLYPLWIYRLITFWLGFAAFVLVPFGGAQ